MESEKTPEPEKSPEPETRTPESAAVSETNPEDKKPAPPEEKKPEPAPAADPRPEHHSAPQFEFKKPTLVVNYPKFNTSFTVGQFTLKAPEPHPVPEPQAPPPVKSFKVSEKLHLDVKIATRKESDDPVISLEFPVKAEKPLAPAKMKAAPKKTKAAPKKFTSAKPLKLRVKVSPAAQEDASSVQPGTAPKRKTPRKNGASPAKKGK